MVSLASVFESVAPTSSQSGKKTSIGVVLRPSSRSARSSGTSSLASKITSPVSRSTTSAMKKARSRSSVPTSKASVWPVSSWPMFCFDSVMPAKIGYASRRPRLWRSFRRSGSSTWGGTSSVNLPAAFRPQADGGVELAQDRLVGLEAQGAQEDRAVELALAVDAHRQHVLLVVLELHPGAAVRDDLRQVGARPLLGEEDARAAVELRDDDPLGAVDDERAVVRHQRDVAEVDLLLLGVAHHARARLRVLVVDEEPEGDLQRHGEGHAALLAVGDRVLELQVDRVAADVALGDPVLVDEPAGRAGHGLLVRVVRHDLRAAVGAGHAQVLEPLELAALALPVADRVLDEVERAGLAEVGEREDAREDRLESLVGPLLGEQVHLQEALVGPPLDVDQVRDGERRRDPREVLPVAIPMAVGRGMWHLWGRFHRMSLLSPRPGEPFTRQAKRRPTGEMSRHHARPTALPR